MEHGARRGPRTRSDGRCGGLPSSALGLILRTLVATVAIAALLTASLAGCGNPADTSPGVSSPPPVSSATPELPETTAPSDESPSDPADQAEPPETSHSSAPKTRPGTVVRVVDGDTAHVRLDDGSVEKVRFIGVDTPESTREIEPYGKEASAYTRRALDGRRVYLETDAELRDRYGRLLAYVWLEKPRTATDAELRTNLFNAKLLLDGYAQVYTFPPNVKYVEAFTRYQREAREAVRGLWSLSAPARAPASGAPYVASKRSDVFHERDCRWAAEIAAHNLLEFGTRDAALDSGRRPCKTCRP